MLYKYLFGTDSQKVNPLCSFSPYTQFAINSSAIYVYYLVHFILNHLKAPGNSCIFIVIRSCCIQLRNFLLKLTLEKPDFSNILQLASQIFIYSLFQPIYEPKPPWTWIISIYDIHTDIGNKFVVDFERDVISIHDIHTDIDCKFV